MELSIYFPPDVSPLVDVWDKCADLPPEGKIAVNAFAFDMWHVGKCLEGFRDVRWSRFLESAGINLPMMSLSKELQNQNRIPSRFMVTAASRVAGPPGSERSPSTSYR